MTPSEKQKEIACTFGWYFFNHDEVDINKCYENWCLTLEGKRLTAQDRSEPEEPAINVLIKISKQFDRFEGRLRGDLFGE